MSDLEDRLNALESRLSARASDLESRLSSRYGAAPASGGPQKAAASGVRPGAAGAAKSVSVRGEGARHGLFVGVNEYAAYPDGSRPGTLRGCVADARNVRDACCELGGWPSARCRLLEDRGATRDAIRGALADLAAAAKP